jgi:Transcriptional regulator PadR-like family
VPLLRRRTHWRYGYELGTETGLKAGSLYPILVRLADRKFLEASWEESQTQAGSFWREVAAPGRADRAAGIPPGNPPRQQPWRRDVLAPPAGAELLD